MGLDHIDLHYRSATATVALPHGPKSGLATQVPAVSYQQSEFDGDHTKTMASRTTKTDNATVDKEKRYITHHRNVTWPRVTFFMLKPTVGMELCHTNSLVKDKVFQMAARSWGGGTYSIVNSPPCATASAWTWDEGEGEGGGGTTHRKHSQQRCLAGILETDHGHVHFGVPASHTSTIIPSIGGSCSHRRRICCCKGAVNGKQGGAWVDKEDGWKKQGGKQHTRRG
jgi:hypothetical protein